MKIWRIVIITTLIVCFAALGTAPLDGAGDVGVKKGECGLFALGALRA